MFLKKRPVRVKKTKARQVRGGAVKRKSVAGPEVKAYSANQTLRVTVPKSIFSGDSESDLVLKEEISVRRFVTSPARVRAEWGWSVEEVKEVGKGKLESEWGRFVISLEVPCYIERLVETQREVIEEVKREAEAQRKEHVGKAARRDFAEKEMQAELGVAPEWIFSLKNPR